MHDTAVVVSLKRQYVPAGNTCTIAATGTTLLLPLLVVSIFPSDFTGALEDKRLDSAGAIEGRLLHQIFLWAVSCLCGMILVVWR